MLTTTYQKLSALFFLVLCAFSLRQTDILSTSTSSLVSVRSLQESTLSNTLCNTFVFNPSYTASQVNSAESIRSFLEMLRGNPLIEQIKTLQSSSTYNGINTTEGNLSIHNNNQQVMADEYGKSMNIIGIFSWIFLAGTVFCLLGYFCTLFSCGRRLCCLFNPEPIKSGRTLFTILSGVLVISLLGLGLAGVVLAGEFHYDTKGAICNGNSFLVNMNRGSVGNNWIGLMGASNALNNFSNYDNALSQDGRTLQTTVGVSMGSIGTTENSMYNVYSKYQNSVLPRADHPATILNYTPDFITSYGPVGPKNTFLTKMMLEMNAFRASNVTHLSMLTSKSYFTEPFDTLQTVTINASLALQNLIDFNDQHSSMAEDTIHQSGTILKVTLIILCIVSLFCTIWWLIGIKRKVKLAPGLICGKWCLMLISIVCWIVSFSYIPSNIEIIETCGVVNRTLSDPFFFNQTLNLLANNSDSLNQYLFTCLYGNKDLPEFFNLKKSAKDFDDNYNSSLETAAATYGEINSPPTKSHTLTKFITQLEAYKNGTISDNKNTTIDLNTLNKNSHSNSTCEPMKDVWALNSLNCSLRKSLKVLQANETDDFNVGYPTCIGFDQWMNGTNMNITNRYNSLQKKHSCRADDQNAKRTKRLVAGFIKNRSNMKTLINNMENDLNLVATNYTAIFKSRKSWIKPLKAVMTDFRLINDTLYNSDLGLMTNLNCGAIKGDLQTFHDSLCIGAVTSAFYMLIILTLISSLTTVASLSLLCLLRRVKAPEGRRSKRRLSASNPLLYDVKLEEEEEAINFDKFNQREPDDNDIVV